MSKHHSTAKAKGVVTTLILVLTLGLVATAAHAFATDDAWDRSSSSGARSYGAVDFVGTNRVDVVFGVRDAPGDAYCTTAKAELWANDSRGYRKLGNTITIGSVCNGRTYTFPVKTITTQAGQIFEVRVIAERGSTGLAVPMDVCRRLTDGAEGCR